MSAPTYNWQQKGWPRFTYNRAHLSDEINAASRSLDWTNWAAFFIPVLTELLTDFLAAMNFVAAKRDYLTKYEHRGSKKTGGYYIKQ